MSEERGGRKTIFTNGVQLFNSHNSKIGLNFIDYMACIAITPVYEEMRGKTPRANKDMYDRDKAIHFAMGPENLIILRNKLDEYIEGKIDEIVIVNKKNSRDAVNKKVLTIQKAKALGADGVPDNNDVVVLEFYADESDKEPEDQLYFYCELPKKKEGKKASSSNDCVAVIIREFIPHALSFIFGATSHAIRVVNSYRSSGFNGGGGGGNYDGGGQRDGGRSGNFNNSRRRESPYTEGDDERGSRGGGKGSGRRASTGDPDDEIPF